MSAEKETSGAVGAVISRLERAKEPDRDIDLAIANLSIDDGAPWFFFDLPKREVTRRRFGPGAVLNPVCALEYFTQYTEEAAEIVPAGLDWAVHQTADGAFATVLTPDAVEHEGAADKPALALCIAALKATAHLQEHANPTASPAEPLQGAHAPPTENEHG